MSSTQQNTENHETTDNTKKSIKNERPQLELGLDHSHQDTPAPEGAVHDNEAHTTPSQNNTTPLPYERYKSLADFYPFYLSQHENKICRLMHFIGTSLVFIMIGLFIYSSQWLYLALMPVAAYGFAWVGHFIFERNRPATFSYPLYSLVCDFLMYRDICMGRLKMW